MDRCEYTKVTEIIENNEKVLEYESCRLLWQEVRYYRARYTANEISGDLLVNVFEPFPTSWSDLVEKGAEKAAGKASGILNAATVGVGIFDLKTQWEIAEDASGLRSRYARSYQSRRSILVETKRYWEMAQHKLYPNCPPTTTSGGGGGSSGKDPTPPREPVKTTSGEKPADQKPADQKTVRTETGGRTGDVKAAVSGADGFFVTYACHAGYRADSTSSQGQAACAATTVQAATEAADIAAGWALGRAPGTGIGPDAAKPDGDPTAFWGDSCQATLELSPHFRPPANRDAGILIDRSRQRGREAWGQASKEILNVRILDHALSKEYRIEDESLANAAKARRGSAAARDFLGEAKKAAERAAATFSELVARQQAAWRWENLALLFGAHADHLRRIRDGAPFSIAPGQALNPAYCAERINYVVALYRPPPQAGAQGDTQTGRQQVNPMAQQLLMGVMGGLINQGPRQGPGQGGQGQGGQGQGRTTQGGNQPQGTAGATPTAATGAATTPGVGGTAPTTTSTGQPGATQKGGGKVKDATGRDHQPGPPPVADPYRSYSGGIIQGPTAGDHRPGPPPSAGKQ